MHIIHHHHKKGFTIIEVSLVLAIAGLIFAMIFIALPALQRQARDTERKEDVLAFIEAIKKYQQNNRGNLPKTKEDSEAWTASFVTNWNNADTSDEWVQFYQNYLGDNFVGSNGQKYYYYVYNCAAETTYTGRECLTQSPYDENDNPTFYIILSSTCDNNRAVRSSNNRNVSIMTTLESGGDYCAST